MTNSPFFAKTSFSKAWNYKEGDHYEITGVDVYGKRLKLISYCWDMASRINLYRGSRWLVRDGKRFLIERVYN